VLHVIVSSRPLVDPVSQELCHVVVSQGIEWEEMLGPNLTSVELVGRGSGRMHAKRIVCFMFGVGACADRHNDCPEF